MCHKLTHTCLYCSREYDCNLSNDSCPTINGDSDRKMCDSCRVKLEDEIEKYIEEHRKYPTHLSPAELLKNE